MPIDFHDPVNSRTYSGREADRSWRAAVVRLADPIGARVVDVGCGGGTYTRAWSEMGAVTVTGVDFSAPILEAARSASGELPGVTFRQGDAAAMGLEGGRADIVFARALVHHVPDLTAVAAEAARLLRPGGTYLIQDRTPEDVAQSGSVTHPRGWLFDVFPRLRDVENARRPDTPTVAAALTSAGFGTLTATSLWEVRRHYADREAYLHEIGTRTGRSILHELSDHELAHLVGELRKRLPDGSVVERDRWTLWRAGLPAGRPRAAAAALRHRPQEPCLPDQSLDDPVRQESVTNAPPQSSSSCRRIGASVQLACRDSGVRDRKRTSAVR